VDVLFFFCLLGISCFFSGSETALFSIGKVAQARLAQSKRASERLLAHLLREPRELLVTVLFGNEITNVALSAVCATIITRVFTHLTLVQQAAVSSAVVVPLLLLVGEITPKTLASHFSEPVARVVARPMALFSAATRPVRFVLRGVTGAAIRLFGGPAESGEAGTIDEREFRTLVDMSTESGVLEQQEQTLIHNVLDFGDQLVRDVMVPADRVFSLPEKTRHDAAIQAVTDRLYSRIPVWRGSPRKIVGVIYAKDLLAMRWGLQPPKPLRAMLRMPLYVLPQMPADALLESFRRHRTHIAIVVDEFGKAVGICTMEDLLEELFGPITDVETEEKGEDAPP